MRKFIVTVMFVLVMTSQAFAAVKVLIVSHLFSLQPQA